MGIRPAYFITAIFTTATAVGVISGSNLAVAQSTPGAGQAVAKQGPVSKVEPAAPLEKSVPEDKAASSSKSASAGQRFVANRPPVRREVSPAPRQTRKPVVADPYAVSGAGAGALAAGGSATGAAAAGAASAAAGEAAGAPDLWSEAEIKEAKANCQNVLRGVDAVYVEDVPIKQGACGSPVVYKVSSVGKGAGVELSPPVTLTCEMIASLDKWMKSEVQPKARSYLGASIVRIETMSSYSCRNAYGRTRSKLSEHGRANAIDIGAFVTAKDAVSVLADWGLTERETKALALKQEAERAAQAAAANRASGVVSSGVPGTIAPMPGTGRLAPPSSMGMMPNRLGGPKADTVGKGGAPAVAEEGMGRGKRGFLRDIHASACKHFGTVLGPEANNAHKNHFHLDMAPRRNANFCQ